MKPLQVELLSLYLYYAIILSLFVLTLYTNIQVSQLDNVQTTDMCNSIYMYVFIVSQKDFLPVCVVIC